MVRGKVCVHHASVRITTRTACTLHGTCLMDYPARNASDTIRHTPGRLVGRIAHVRPNLHRHCGRVRRRSHRLEARTAVSTTNHQLDALAEEDAQASHRRAQKAPPGFLPLATCICETSKQLLRNQKNPVLFFHFKPTCNPFRQIGPPQGSRFHNLWVRSSAKTFLDQKIQQLARQYICLRVSHSSGLSAHNLQNARVNQSTKQHFCADGIAHPGSRRNVSEV